MKATSTANVASLVSWLAVAGVFGYMVWTGFTTDQLVTPEAQANSDGLRALWRGHGIMSGIMLLLWLPFGVLRHSLPAPAAGVCALGVMLAVAGVPFYDPAGRAGPYWVATAVLGVCAIIQLTIRFGYRAPAEHTLSADER